MNKGGKTTATLCRVVTILAEADKPLKPRQVRDALLTRFGMDLAQSTIWRALQTLAEYDLAKRPCSDVRGWVLKLTTK